VAAYLKRRATLGSENLSKLNPLRVLVLSPVCFDSAPVSDLQVIGFYRLKEKIGERG